MIIKRGWFKTTAIAFGILLIIVLSVFNKLKSVQKQEALQKEVQVLKTELNRAKQELKKMNSCSTCEKKAGLEPGTIEVLINRSNSFCLAYLYKCAESSPDMVCYKIDPDDCAHDIDLCKEKKQPASE